MSLATRCTHCGTIFKVVQDQLKVSEGWVRCGRCNEVFNALPALFDLDKDPPPPRPAHANGPAAPTQSAPSEEQAYAPPPSVPQPEPQVDWAPPEPAPYSGRADTGGAGELAAQGLLSQEELSLGIDSQPPGAWARTQPADFAPSALSGEAPLQTQAPKHTLDEDDLALDPTPIEGTTDFELDTSIAVDDNTPLEVVLAATSGGRIPMPAPQGPVRESTYVAHPAPAHQPWMDEPPDDVPSTDEADALDSRYLMPNERERRAPRRRDSGPEFADAQFPSDAMIDAEEDWASDFGPSALDADAATPAPPPAPTARVSQAPQPVSTTALRVTASAQPAPLAASAAGASQDDIPTLPSRFASDFEPEQAMLPPSERPGQPGTRGRDKADQTPEFLKRAQRKAFWRHPAMRAVLSLMALTLVVTLSLQLVHQFRDLIAAWHPASRPLLAQWCELADCKLTPPLRLEALQVDNLELMRTSSEGPDSYRLTVVVRNQAGIDLAWPHVDLTLTDDNGAVIARRVFSPNDAQWLDTADPKANAADAAKAASMAASVPTAAPSQRSTTLQWRIKATDLHPAGYTAELFYP